VHQKVPSFFYFKETVVFLIAEGTNLRAAASLHHRKGTVLCRVINLSLQPRFPFMRLNDRKTLLVAIVLYHATIAVCGPAIHVVAGFEHSSAQFLGDREGGNRDAARFSRPSRS
jgi:hypothetical protein